MKLPLPWEVANRATAARALAQTESQDVSSGMVLAWQTA